MRLHWIRYAFLIAVVSYGLVTWVRVRLSSAYHQAPDQVVTREPGHRLLGSTQPIANEGRKDMEFAWLSEAAYDRAPNSDDVKSGDCPPADATLQNGGWKRWTDFPDPDLLKKISISNLRLEVWSNEAEKAVAVTFGGTIFTSGKDWKSNLRWFIPFHNDEYTTIVKQFGPAFVQEYSQREQLPEWAYLQGATLFSTGHSLGGGLAQQFAYALPIHDGVPLATKVFAFDPSPVTGFYSVPKAIRDHNSANLAIDRIYERGEILAYLRSFINFWMPPSSVNPTIRQVRYNLFYTRDPIKGHSIADLACKLSQYVRPSGTR